MMLESITPLLDLPQYKRQAQELLEDFYAVLQPLQLNLFPTGKSVAAKPRKKPVRTKPAGKQQEFRW